ncbi:MAG: PIN domain-containing protein [Proteobacteria bacterium]|jgi:toxin-antitoxin system PIN domain toxin|nr:PIN domain-containing protein [Pseudomonadota bacterium]
MRALLDVNVLIALLDADHSLHERARRWFGGRNRREWASCPITQNGCVRIMSHPNYPNAVPVDAVMGRLREACATALHEFWPDDASVLDAEAIDSARLHGPRQVTDIYLLALAVRHGGEFVTFDTSIAGDSVKGFDKHHLLVL